MFKEVSVFLGLSKKDRSLEDIERNLKRVEVAKEFAGQVRLQKFPFDIQKILIFGSVARKEDEEGSDIDLAIVIESDIYSQRSYEKLVTESKLEEIAREIAHLRLGGFEILPIHLTILSSKQFELWKDLSAVIQKIHKEGVEL